MEYTIIVIIALVIGTGIFLALKGKRETAVIPDKDIDNTTLLKTINTNLKRLLNIAYFFIALTVCAVIIAIVAFLLPIIQNT